MTEITDVKVFLTNDEKYPKKKANISFTLNDDFNINGVALINGEHGYFLGFPEKYNKITRKSFGYAHPHTSEYRKIMTDAAIKAYETALEPA